MTLERWMEAVLALILAVMACMVGACLAACTTPVTTPTPLPATPMPNACETRVAVAMQTVDAAMATYVPLATMCANCLQLTPTCVQNVATITPFCTLTATPVTRCQSCATASECPSGTTCYGFGGVLFCVPRDSLNGAYQECLRQMLSLTLHSYEGPPDELVDFEALREPMRERRGP